MPATVLSHLVKEYNWEGLLLQEKWVFVLYAAPTSWKVCYQTAPPPQTPRKTIFNRSLFFHASRWNILLRRAFWTQMQIRFSVCLFLTFTFDLSTPVVYPKSIAASSISLSAFDCKIEQTKWLASVYRGVCSTTLHTCLRDASNSCWEMRNGSARASCSKCSYYSNLLDAANSPLSLF